jgi:hypothetical protein
VSFYFHPDNDIVVPILGSSFSSSKHNNDSIETQQDASMWSMAGEDTTATTAHSSSSSSTSTSLSSITIGNDDDDPMMYHHHGMAITIIVTVTLMWCLGIWKSTFFVNPPHVNIDPPSNSQHGGAIASFFNVAAATSRRRNGWIAFAVETVVVLMICIMAAFGTGRVLSRLFLPDYILQVAKTGRAA